MTFSSWRGSVWIPLIVESQQPMNELELINHAAAVWSYAELCSCSFHETFLSYIYFRARHTREFSSGPAANQNCQPQWHVQHTQCWYPWRFNELTRTDDLLFIGSSAAAEHYLGEYLSTVRESNVQFICAAVKAANQTQEAPPELTEGLGPLRSVLSFSFWADVVHLWRESEARRPQDRVTEDRSDFSQARSFCNYGNMHITVRARGSMKEFKQTSWACFVLWD